MPFLFLMQLKLKMAALEQQIVDRDDLNAKSTSLLEAAKEQKSNLEDSLNLYKLSNEKNERRLKECIREITKVWTS